MQVRLYIDLLGSICSWAGKNGAGLVMLNALAVGQVDIKHLLLYCVMLLIP